MMKSPVRLLALLLAAVLTLALVGCGAESPASSSTPVVSDSGVGDKEDLSTPPTTGKPVAQGTLNPLTGKNDMNTVNNRPVAFVITDEDSRHIQINLDKADFYFEAENEAGIPRILAVFSSIDRIPDEIGPVRSARPHFVKMAAAMDALYSHIGGSYSGLSTIKELGVDDIYGAEQQNSVLASSQNFSWNRKTFVKSRVMKAIQNRGYSLKTSQTGMYQFGNKEGVNPATTVDVKISNNYNMAFTYNAEKGVYQKHRNSLNTPIHTTYSGNGYTGGTIEASNVIVMYDTRFTDPLDNTRIDFVMKSGSGFIATAGKSREIRWENTANGMKYFEADGTTPLTVAVGKTYVCLASDTLKDRTVVK